MALLNNDQVESSQGFEKGIDKAGLGMVLDNLQKYQYSKPLPSAIRETASNAVDSMKERDIAKSILSGESQVEDHYVVDAEGDVYNASKFDPTYYNLEYLSDEKNVEIKYYEREDEDRDLLVFKDYGVGLGNKRLEGFFSLSYSTKRLNKHALGKFGIGAKAPLSTGVQSFRVTSVYNGRKMSFDIFSRFVQPITSQWSEGAELHTMSDGSTYYSEPTDEKNGVQIELEVKKHMRSTVKESIRTQLMYFKNLTFDIIHSENWTESVPVSTDIHFENEYFIIPKNNLFTRPHIVLGTPGSYVNYGPVDFRELEQADVIGNVGIKPIDVEVNPSRESIIWSPETGEKVTYIFRKAQETAADLVNEMMKEDDYLKWIHKNVSLVSSNIGSNPVLMALSGMINKDEINASYPPKPEIKYSTFRKMVGIYPILRNISIHNKWVKDKYKSNVIRTEISSWASANMEKLYFTRESVNKRKDAYIIKEIVQLEEGSFSLISIPNLDDEFWKERKEYWEKQYSSSHQRALALLGQQEDISTPEEIAAKIEEELDIELAEWNKALEFLEMAKVSEFYKDYDALVVPAEWVDEVVTDDDLKQDVIAETTGLPSSAIQSPLYTTAAERRKAQNKVIFKYANWSTNKDYHHAKFNWSKYEEDADVLNAFDGTLVYATQAEWVKNENPGDDSEVTKFREVDSDEDKLKMIAGMLLPETGVMDMVSDFDNRINGFRSSDFDNFTEYALYPFENRHEWKNRLKGSQDLALIKVSKPLASKLKAFIPVSRFLMDMDKHNKIFIHMKLVNWFTAKQVNKIVQKLQFLHNFHEISSHHAEIFKELYQSVKGHNFSTYGRLTDYPYEMQKAYEVQLEELFKFQRMVAEDKPAIEDIAEYALQHFAVPATDAHVVDLDVIKKAEDLLDWASPVMEMLNNIPYFTEKSHINKVTNKEEFLEGIRHYMRSKSVDMIQLPQVVVPQEVKEEDED